MITIEQIRAARALLDWSQGDLAERAGLSQTGIARIEGGSQTPTVTTLEKIINTFDRADIEFIGKSGVQKKSGDMQRFEGSEGFVQFYHDIYTTMKNSRGKEVFVSNVDEREFVMWQGDQLTEHTMRMRGLGVTYKILVEEGDTYFPALEYAEYRWIPKEQFTSVPFYIYNSNLAMIIFGDNPQIFVIDHPVIAKAFTEQFESLWSVSIIPKLK